MPGGCQGLRVSNMRGLISQSLKLTKWPLSTLSTTHPLLTDTTRFSRLCSVVLLSPTGRYNILSSLQGLYPSHSYSRPVVVYQGTFRPKSKT
jgi:hypothetical protein